MNRPLNLSINQKYLLWECLAESKRNAEACLKYKWSSDSDKKDYMKKIASIDHLIEKIKTL